MSNNKLAMAEADKKVMEDWPTPTNSKEVQRFLELANYHRVFVPNFAEISADLYSVVGKLKFQWVKAQHRAFEKLRKALTSPLVPALPNAINEFALDTDASNVTVTGQLIHIQ